MEFDNKTSGCERGSTNYMKEILEWVQVILIAIIISTLFKGFLFETTLVNMSSMQDTLFEGQTLIVYKMGYHFSPPKRGDIITFEHQPGLFKGVFKFVPFPNPGEIDYIKRVIGLPGDEISLKDGHVYINGKKLDEPYVKGLTYPQSFTLPQKVPENKVFAMGDNRQNSSDSRTFGFVDYNKIRGKAVYRIWPFKVAGSIYKSGETK